MQPQSTPTLSDSECLSTVYALLDQQGAIRYIGITKWPLRKRLTQHLHEAARGGQSHRCKWLRTLIAPPPIIAIEKTTDRLREIFWIAHYRAVGCNLTNATDGGEGLLGMFPTVETRAKMSHSQRTTPHHRGGNYAGSKLSDEHVDAIRTGLIGHKISDETKAKIGAANKGRIPSAETRAKMSAKQLGRKHSQETRAKMAENHWSRRKASAQVTL